MQNFELDLSRWIPCSYEVYFGRKIAKVNIFWLLVNWIWLGSKRIRGGKGNSSGATGWEDGPNSCQLDPKIGPKKLVSSYSAVQACVVARGKSDGLRQTVFPNLFSGVEAERGKPTWQLHFFGAGSPSFYACLM